MAITNLAEFLAQTNYTYTYKDDQDNDVTVTRDYTAADGNGIHLVDADEAANEANAYVNQRLWRIQGDVRKTQVETAVIVNDTMDRLEAQIATETDENKLALAKAVYKALSNLYKPEFYINLNDTTVKTMFDNAVALSVLNTNEKTEIEAAATYYDQPIQGATGLHVKAVWYPATWKDVTIESGNDKVVLPEGDVFLNQSNKGGFRFTVTAAESFTGSVRVKMYAGKASDGVIAEQAGVNIVFTADFVAGEAMVPQSVIRTAPLQGYKWFKFKYLEPYEGALTSVSVEGLA